MFFVLLIKKAATLEVLELQIHTSPTHLLLFVFHAHMSCGYCDVPSKWGMVLLGSCHHLEIYLLFPTLLRSISISSQFVQYSGRGIVSLA